MTISKKVKTKGSSHICGLHHFVHKTTKTTLANPDFDGEGSTGSSTSISKVINPKCSSLRNTKENKSRQVSQRPQPQEKLTLQDLILNSPSLNKIYPESIETGLQLKDIFSLERVEMKADEVEEMEKDCSIMMMRNRSPSGKKKKNVRFRLPEVGDIFLLDSEDGYYFSNRLNFDV